MSATKLTRERLHAVKRKKQIVQVVLKLIAEHGVDAVSTQLIADRIGFTQAAVFRHFPTKKALWSAVMDWLEEQLTRVRQRARTEATDEGFGVLERIFFGHVALIERHPGLAKAIMSDHIRRQYPELHKRFAIAHKEYASEIRKALDAAAKSAQISPKCDRDAATTLFLCAIQGLGFQFSIARVLPSMRKDAVRIFRLFERSLGAPQIPSEP
jgi:TetR/AcrR family transcriptional regulator